MPNLQPSPQLEASYSFAQNLKHSRCDDAVQGVQIGRDHVDAQYLAPSRVTTRQRELQAAGYPPHLASFAVRLEARENTLLDMADSPGLSDAGEHELAAVQRLLMAIHLEARDLALMQAALNRAA